MTKTHDGYLDGQLLIAMPDLQGGIFANAVIFLADHDEQGAMGLILNKPTDDLHLSDLAEQLDIDDGPGAGIRVHIGGPVETGRGFVVHTIEQPGIQKALPGAFMITGTLDIVEEMMAGTGPDKARIMLGYAGWGAGQLEAEFAGNSWLVTDATPELVFDTPVEQLWERALESAGINPILLSHEGGQA